MTGVRAAATSDLPSLHFLLHAYLTEMRSKGSEIQPTTRTVDFYSELATNYVDGEVEGVVIVAHDNNSLVGFSMAGDCTLPIDSDYGKTAIGWGTYVVPSSRGQHLGDALRHALRNALRSAKFDTVLGGTYINDSASLCSVQHTGWRPYQIMGYDDLRRGD